MYRIGFGRYTIRDTILTLAGKMFRWTFLYDAKSDIGFLSRTFPIQNQDLSLP